MRDKLKINKWKDIFYAHGYSQSLYTTGRNPHIHCNLHQNYSAPFQRQAKIPKIFMESQKLLNI